MCSWLHENSNVIRQVMVTCKSHHLSNNVTISWSLQMTLLQAVVVVVVSDVTSLLLQVMSTWPMPLYKRKFVKDNPNWQFLLLLSQALTQKITILFGLLLHLTWNSFTKNITCTTWTQSYLRSVVALAYFLGIHFTVWLIRLSTTFIRSPIRKLWYKFNKDCYFKMQTEWII